MRSVGRALVYGVDSLVAGLELAVRKEQGILLTFLFHSVFQTRDEARAQSLDPQQGTTVEMLRELVRYFKSQGYIFTSPKAILQGLSPKCKYVMLTFDDGYYNNTRALPVLEEYDVPAIFFISSSHVSKNKSFWWDALYRGSAGWSLPFHKIQQEINSYKHLKTSEIEGRLTDRFGPAVMTPVSDLDRPFTSDELRSFASHPLVSIGNHTSDHAILANYSDAEIRDQIMGCQKAIERWTGRLPEAISYPNGRVSGNVIRIAQACGLQIGVLCRPGRERLPLASEFKMSVNRYTIWGDHSISSQCKTSRSFLSLYRLTDRVRSEFSRVTSN